ncbi:hypothetical protein MBLNU13_g03671t1 [Cladosporium sp. NU13]
MGPPGGDFGALFGSGSGIGGGNAVESGWTWMAPGTQPAPTKTTSNGWNWGAKPAKPPAEWEQLLEIPRTGAELVEESRETFEELLQAAEGVEVLRLFDMKALTEFLASSANEPAAKNVWRLVQWLSGRSVSDPAWNVITDLICDKIKLASMDDEELLKVIRALPGALDWEQDESAQHRLHRIYAAFADNLEDRAPSRDLLFQTMFEEVHKATKDAQACSRLIAMLIRTIGNGNVEVLSENIALTLLAIHNCGAEGTTRTQLLSELQMALGHIPSAAITEVLRLATRAIFDNGRSVRRYKGLQALTWLDCVTPAPFPVDHMSIVYAEIAKHITLSQIVERFAPRHVDDSDIARSLLRIWLPNAGPDNFTRSRLKRGNAAYSLHGYKLIPYGYCSPSSEDLAAVEVEFEILFIRARNRNAWPTLVKAFKRKGLSYLHVVDLVLEICKVRDDPKTIYSIFFKMLKDEELAIPTNIYVSVIGHLMAKGENYLAYKVFCESPSIALTDVPELPIALLEDRNVKNFDIYEMLNRKPSTVPMEWRERLKLAVTDGHIEVVHMLAHKCAHMESLRPSQAYRNVWALYRWLQDRGAPIQPLMSRAMVTAGILRHINARKWIPDERLEYILSIVEKVEGVEVREKAEQLATYMRASVHDSVIAARKAREESAWMNKSTYMAGQAKFRLKKWTKLKPLPTGDGRSFVVPQCGSPGTMLPASDFDDWDTRVSTVRRPGYEERNMATSPSGALPSDETSNQQDLHAGPAAGPVLWRPIEAATGEDGKMDTLLSDTTTNTVDALTSEESSEYGRPAQGRKKRDKSARQTSASTEDSVEFDDAFSTHASADRRPACEERKPEIAPWD